MQWTSAIPERHGSRSGAAFDEIPERVHTHTEIQATHANTHGISIGIGYAGIYARKVNGDYPSVLVEHRAAASASPWHRSCIGTATYSASPDPRILRAADSAILECGVDRVISIFSRELQLSGESQSRYGAALYGGHPHVHEE